MLTATYSLIAIKAEQDKAHGLLARLRQYVESAWQGVQRLDFSIFDTAFNKLLQFDDYCRTRKVELYLIPALRRVTREADVLIAELDTFSASSAGLLRSIRGQLAGVLDAGGNAAHEFCRSIELYCDSMQARLQTEDAKLLPMARRVLSIDEWFSIAAQFLSDKAEVGGRHRYLISMHRPDSNAAGLPLH